MKTKSLLLALSLLIFVVVEIFWPDSLIEVKRFYNSSIFEPLGYISLSVGVTFFILMFFNNDIYVSWLKNLMTWFTPLSLVLILSGTTGSSYAWFSRSDLSIFFGVSLVIITTVYVLASRFYFKR